MPHYDITQIMRRNQEQARQQALAVQRQPLSKLKEEDAERLKKANDQISQIDQLVGPATFPTTEQPPVPEGAPEVLSDADKELKQKWIAFLVEKALMPIEEINAKYPTLAKLKEGLMNYQSALRQFYTEGIGRAASQAFNIENYAREHNLTLEQALNELAGSLDIPPEEFRKIINDRSLVEYWANKYDITTQAALQRLSEELHMTMGELQNMIEKRGLIENYQQGHHMDLNQAWAVLAGEFDLTVDRLQELVKEYKENPYSNEWMTVPVDLRFKLAGLAGVVYSPETAYQKYLTEDYIPVGGHVQPSNFQYQIIDEYAKAHNMTWKQAHELINKMRDNPDSQIIKDLSEQDRTELYGVITTLKLGHEYISKQDYERLLADDRELASVLRRHGFQAYKIAAEAKDKQLFREAIQDQPQELQVAFESGGVEGYNKAVTAYNERIQKEIDASISQLPQELQEAYRQGGVNALDNAIREHNANSRYYNYFISTLNEVNSNIIRQQTQALAQLSEYRELPESYEAPDHSSKWVQETMAGKPQMVFYIRVGGTFANPVWEKAPTQEPFPEEGYVYSIDEFIKAHPTEDSYVLLKEAGFRGEVLNAARIYIDVTNKSIADVNDIIKKYGTTPNRINESSETMALERAMAQSGLGYQFPSKIVPYIGAVFYDPETGEELTTDFDVFQAQWELLTDEQRAVVAGLYARDTTKGNLFAAYNQILNDIVENFAKQGYIQEKVAGYVSFPVLGITNPIAKQLTLSETKKLYAEEYANELKVLKEYINTNGTFNIDKLNIDIKKTPSLGNNILTDLGYANLEDLKNNLEAYNNAQSVSPAEWAGLAGTAAFDFLMLGGAGFIGSLARGATARTAAALRATVALSTTAGGIFTAQTIQDWRDMSWADRTLAVFMDVLMFLPLLSVIKRYVTEPNLASRQRRIIEEIFENDREAYKRYATNNPNSPKNYANEFDIKYQEWVDNLQTYCESKLEIEQAKEALSKLEGEISVGPQGAQKSIELLIKKAQARIEKLTEELPRLENEAKKSYQELNDLVTPMAGSDAADVITAMKDKTNLQIKSMNNIIEQLTHPRDQATIRQDIANARRELYDVKKGDATNKLVHTEYLNELKRELYLANLEDAQTIYKQSVKANQLVEEIRDELLNTEYKGLKGQELADKIAEDFGLEALPVRKMGIIKKIKNPNLAGEYNTITNEITLRQINDIESALHELTHHKITEEFSLNDAERLNSIADLSKNDIELIVRNGKKTVGGRSLTAANIADKFEELATIEYVKKVSGIDNAGYRKLIMDNLASEGKKIGNTNLAENVYQFAKEYVRELKTEDISVRQRKLMGNSMELLNILAKNIKLKSMFAESVYKFSDEVKRYTQEGKPAVAERSELIRQTESEIAALYKQLKSVKNADMEALLKERIGEAEQNLKYLRDERFASMYEEVPHGKDFGGIKYKLDYLKDSILARINDSKLAEELIKNLKKLDDAYIKGDGAGVKKAAESITKENPRVQARLNEYLDRIKKVAADREEALRKWQESKTQANKETAEQAFKRSQEVLKETVDKLNQENIYKARFEEWRRAEIMEAESAQWEKESINVIKERAEREYERIEQARRERFDRFLNDKERKTLRDLSLDLDIAKQRAKESLEYARMSEAELNNLELNNLSEENLNKLQQLWKDIYLRREEGTGRFNTAPKVSWEGIESVKKRIGEIIDDLYKQSSNDAHSVNQIDAEYKEYSGELNQKIADSSFDGNTSALDKYIDEGIWPEGKGELTEESSWKKTSREDYVRALDEIEKIFKDNANKELKAALQEVEELLKNTPDELKPKDNAVIDINEELKKILQQANKKGTMPPVTKGVPTQITKNMEVRLKELGYTQKQINAMKPQEAWDILNRARGEERIPTKPQKEKPPTRKGGGQRIQTAVKEKTETEAKTARELEEELYNERKTKLDEETIKRLKRARERVETKPEIKARPFPMRLPSKKVSVGPAPREGEELEPVRSQPLLKRLLQTSTKVKEFPQPVTKTFPSTKTQIQTKIMPATKTKTATGTQVKAQPEPQPQTKPQTKTQQMIKTAVATETQTETWPETKPQPKMLPVLGIHLTTTTPTPDKPTKKIPIKSSSPPEKKPWTKEEIASAVAFAFGKLKRKTGLQPVIYARKEPYTDTPENTRIFIGNPPAGMKISPDIASAKKTIQLLGGKSPALVEGKIGFQGYKIRSPSKIPGGAIAFHPINQPARLHSEKRGKVYHTDMGSGQSVMSRRPLRNIRKRR